MSDELLSGSARRLAEELEEDGVKLDEHDGVRELLLDELDYARRIPMFEGRRPLYGSFSMPPGTSIATAGGIADLVPLDGLPREMARTFADGRSAFVVNRHDEQPGAGLLRPARAVRGRARPAAGGHRRPHRAAHADVRPGPPVHRGPRRLVGRPGVDRPPDRRRAAGDAAPVRARPRPRRRPRAARPRRALAVAGPGRRDDRRPRAALRLGVDGRGDEVPRPEAVDQATASTSRRCSPRCSSTTWRRW